METSSAKRRKLSPGEGASAGSDGGRDSTPLQPQARSELQVKLPFDPFARRGLRRSPQSADATARSSGGRGVGISPRPRQRKPLADFVIRRDPEQTHHLPPTPIQLGIEDPVVTNIPKGLSNSPTKKLRRRFYERAFAPPPLPRQLSRDSSANADKENVDPQEAYLSTEDLLLQKAAAAEAENEEKTRRDLEAELEQLRKDVRLLEDELEAPDSYTDDQLASCPDLL